jgi:IclR family transcriptional regulator, pca regulon regulatory protein
VLLANLMPDDLAAYLRRVKLAPYTNRTVVSKERLAETLAGVRDAGYAIVDQELEIGLRSIAVPVKDYRSRVAAAINISVQAPRVSIGEMEKSFLPQLRLAAEELGMLGV